MNPLRIPVTSIGEEGLTLDAWVPVREVQPPGTRPVPMDEVRVAGFFQEMGGEFLFRGRLRGVYAQPCDRCLAEARVPLDAEVAWVYAERPDGVMAEISDEDDGLPEGEDGGAPAPPVGVILLAPKIWEELVLAAPLKMVCGESCRGLCPRCGANLNEGDCACSRTAEKETAETPESPLAALARLFPELANKKSEE